VRKLLEAGEERGRRQLARQPLDQAELFGVIARLRLGLGDYREAERLLETQSRILRDLPNAPDSLLLSSASDYGRTLRLLDRSQECIARMQPLETLARSQQRQLPVQAADFHSELGRCLRDRNRDDQRRIAQRLFMRSLEVRRNTLEDTAGVVENLADLANLQADEGKTEAALQGFRNALAQLNASVGVRHPLAIELQRRLCDLERTAGQLAIAERDCHDALTLALELHGDDHPASIDARRQLAAIHVDQGRFREAETAFRDSHRWLVARLGRDHEDIARNDNSLGTIAWERGDIDGALRHLDRSLGVLRKDPDAALYQGVLFNKAMVLHDAGRDRAALPLLLQVERLRIRALGPSHPRIGDTRRLIGEVQAALGQDTAARASLSDAVRLTRESRDYGPSHPHTRRAELSLALFELEHDEPRTDATTTRLQELAALPKSDPELRKVAWLAAAAIAVEGCTEPTTQEDARATLDAIAAEIAAALPEGGAIARAFDRRRERCR
jgi:serine/threonine-protein kinase